MKWVDSTSYAQGEALRPRSWSLTFPAGDRLTLHRNIHYAGWLWGFRNDDGTVELRTQLVGDPAWGLDDHGAAKEATLKAFRAYCAERVQNWAILLSETRGFINDDTN